MVERTNNPNKVLALVGQHEKHIENAATQTPNPSRTSSVQKVAKKPISTRRKSLIPKLKEEVRAELIRRDVSEERITKWKALGYREDEVLALILDLDGDTGLAFYFAQLGAKKGYDPTDLLGADPLGEVNTPSARVKRFAIWLEQPTA